ncbi:hypothetical protein BU25DRAFT_23829 [Macroventuria anomochaeta]|uniref:Uncharacterized protein n=1 Tax=Macroventuria anomochaeta TaxID=301207 RepID=A0ACB6S4M7_9PLEO|nr:uncharacterized protein BU25DRAFT_23829 [Macroventuria anomochaeta]KAF2628922.1 hypothetical protein BU25DRAFT_23829 [Macroventuria anomochaeta]
MAFRLEDTILALIRPPSCTIRLFLLYSLLFVFRAIIIPLVTDCYGRQTNLGRWTYPVAALLLLLAELKHAPMARQLSSCRLLFIALFQALFLLVSDWTCTPCCRLVQIVAPGLPCLSIGSIDLPLMIVFITVTNQNWS